MRRLYVELAVPDEIADNVSPLDFALALFVDVDDVAVQDARWIAAGPQATSDQLQRRTGDWHRARFPAAEQTNVALKATEELGEVAEAVNALAGVNSANPDGALSVPAEAADVVIALLALVDRWHPGVDLLTEVGRKLAVLEDPTSGHRSAARVVDDDPAQFAQVDGGEHCPTLRDALEQAAYKVSFTLHTGERVRLVRDEASGAFIYQPFDDDLREALINIGLTDDKTGSLDRSSRKRGEPQEF